MADSAVHGIENPLVQKHRARLARPQAMVIDGALVPAASGDTLPVFDPSNGQPVSSIPRARAADVDRAVRAARAAFESPAWSALKPVARQRLLLRLADLVEEHADELAELESIDNGKALTIARASDVSSVVDVMRYMAGWATKITGQTLDVSVPRMPTGEFFAYTTKQPVGVVAGIVPWNFPLSMATWKVAPALATGCTIVLKPAEQTSLTALRLGELALEAGYPPGVLNVVTGLGAEAGDALIRHPGVDKISFTGSVTTGKTVGRAAVDHLKRFTLELGGKSPVIVLGDAKVADVAPAAALAIFFNQGQTCTAGSRLYVHRSIFDEVVQGVAEYARNLRIGPGFDPNAQVNPLVSQEHAKRVCGYIDTGREEGATFVLEGGRVDRSGYYVSPTIMVNTTPQMRVVKEEIFGPVLVAMPFDTEDEVVSYANAFEFDLAASVWTRDISAATRLSRRVRAGIVWLNCHNLFDPNLPFGGFRHSGIGRDLGQASIEGCLETKSVLLRL
jgi:phenylacetaldehyde dehydrogenase